jgi:hypothetical protein
VTFNAYTFQQYPHLSHLYKGQVSRNSQIFHKYQIISYGYRPLMHSRVRGAMNSYETVGKIFSFRGVWNSALKPPLPMHA